MLTLSPRPWWSAKRVHTAQVQFGLRRRCRSRVPPGCIQVDRDELSLGTTLYGREKKRLKCRAVIGWILYLQHSQMRTNQRVGKSGREWGRVGQSGAHVVAVECAQSKSRRWSRSIVVDTHPHEFSLLGVACAHSF